MKKLYTYIAYLSVIFIIVSFLTGMYLLFYTPKYFDTEQPFRTEKETYYIGDTLTYTSVYCKHREYIPLSIKRNLVGGYVYPLPVQSENSTSLGTFPVGCRTVTVEVPLALPLSTPTNKKYHIEITIEYKINALQTQTRTFRTNEFTLLKK